MAISTRSTRSRRQVETSPSEVKPAELKKAKAKKATVEPVKAFTTEPAIEDAPTIEDAAKLEPSQPAQAEDDACGLQKNASLTDAEVLEMMAPADALEEELRLQKEREDAEKKAKAPLAALKDKALDKSKFAALEHLLRQSETYTQFLAEQIKDIELKTEEEAAARVQAEAEAEAGPSDEGKAGKAGGKRGRGGKCKDAAEPATKQVKTGLTKTQELLPLMNGDMRDYQLKGVKWLISLYQNGINGILADQMGLGKTVQTIGFISYLRSRDIHAPFLVLGPLSTLGNWLNEFKRFLPSCPAIMYHGSKQEREELRATKLRMEGGRYPADFPVIITSYEIVIADVKFLSKFKFKYIVVDEGHRLKNFQCKLIRELKTIPAENRLLLSGTPLQNNLSELWSLLNFLMPDVFSSMSDFEAWFDFSSMVGQEGADLEILAAEQRNQVVSKLHAILKPFVLRRLKSDVEISLPRKMEIILYADMTPEQRALNQQLVDGKLKEEMRALAEREGTGSSSTAMGKLNNVLMQMRKICNHPDLVTSAFTNDIDYPPPEELVRQCGKMALLDRLLKDLRQRGHKVLIFSQMTKMLDLIESYLEQSGHRACRIDGSVAWQDRQQSINDFNQDKDTWLFLLSTRAGGLGINLVAADTVIIYDSDWNPHQDMQAMDRCHRIGQTRPVLVFRLATAHSVEGKMLRRAANKMALERLVIKKGAFKELASAQEAEAAKAGSLSAGELLELLEGDYRMDDVPQTGVVGDTMLNTLLDRSHLEVGNTPPFPTSGVGYEVVQVVEGGGMLNHINS
uniref:Uncharacterized protein n=1 Tax=Chlamydomonas leiostraca TaxID=1034604 RepID=A0A7S0RU61_9CHLO|mmetsp:Transcript_31717/g.80862  ORF Transcript_31717/g.80862 Transcript_31717/m.80862 type:complete len:796 (+) Transcript_31717:76-2463(+)